MFRPHLVFVFLQITKIFSFENYPDCGVSLPSTRHKTETTDIKHYPWSAALMIDDDGWKLHCSASIISSKYLLTAGHCMFYEDGTKIDKTKLQIVLGADDLNKTDPFLPKFVQKHKIKEFWAHDDYDKIGQTIDYDIAIIEVTPEIKFEVIFDNIVIFSASLFSVYVWHTQALHHTAVLRINQSKAVFLKQNVNL
jgi:secreted trypsin-like serine protease